MLGVLYGTFLRGGSLLRSGYGDVNWQLQLLGIESELRICITGKDFEGRRVLGGGDEERNDDEIGKEEDMCWGGKEEESPGVKCRAR